MKRIVNEPTAAALAYGFNRGLDQKVLVYDLGGGTFDVSVLQLTGNVFEVLATGGDTFLGGVDFDNRIIDYVLEDVPQADEDRPVAEPDRDAADQERGRGGEDRSHADPQRGDRAAVHRRSARASRSTCAMPLSREQLNALTGDLVDAHLRALRPGAGREGHRAQSTSTRCILVGGQSRMPLVQQQIQQHFGKPPRKGVHPDECVALGAALLGDSLGQIDAVTLIDALSMPIGFALPSGRFRKIIEKNTQHPARRRASACRRRASRQRAHRAGHLPGRQRADRRQRVPRHGEGAGGGGRASGSTSSSTKSACCT